MPLESAHDDLANDDDVDCDVILSREEMQLLQAFHRFVPLPALSSNILRVVCEDDIQVHERSQRHHAPIDEARGPSVALPHDDPSPDDVDSGDDNERQRSPRAPSNNNAARVSAATIPPPTMSKNSPLTRRLSKTNIIKPRVSIDLTQFTPRVQGRSETLTLPAMSSPSSTRSER